MASKLTVEPGRYIMVKHKGDREWHEFLVTAVVSGTAPRYVILTPDEDHYVLDLNGDVDELFLVGPNLRLPPRVAQDRGVVYRFDERYTDKELKLVFNELHVMDNGLHGRRLIDQAKIGKHAPLQIKEPVTFAEPNTVLRNG